MADLHDAPARPPRARRRLRVGLMGIAIDALTERDAVEQILTSLRRGQGGWVVTANLDQVRLARQSPDLAGIFASADLVTVDGTTLLWASRLMGTPLPERVAGADLIVSLSAAAAEANASVFLLGGNPGIAEKAAEVLRARYPALRIAGVACPPHGFESDPAWMDRLHRALRDARPDLVYVCLGFPKQERTIARLRSAAPGAWFLGLGGSLSCVAGEFPRAPRWMQRLALEWLHRLIQEPRRLFERFVILDFPFALRLFAHASAARARSWWQEAPIQYLEIDEPPAPGTRDAIGGLITLRRR